MYSFGSEYYLNDFTINSVCFVFSLKVCKDSLDKCHGKVAYEKVTKEQLDIKKLLCNLCWAAIKGHLKIDQVVSTFSDVVVCQKRNSSMLIHFTFMFYLI